MLNRTPTVEPRHGCHAATVVGLDAEGRPLVDVDGASVVAQSTVSVGSDDVGRSAMVTFLQGDVAQPVITGLFVDPSTSPRAREVKLNAESLQFAAASKITLTCGKASITLSRDGKIVVQGARLLSRASGVNRIRGGTITLN